jgi:hypothetical protein
MEIVAEAKLFLFEDFVWYIKIVQWFFFFNVFR